MLINFVKDSVLQCFCHTCRAPLPPAGEILRREAVRDKLTAARGVNFVIGEDKILSVGFVLKCPCYFGYKALEFQALD